MRWQRKFRKKSKEKKGETVKNRVGLLACFLLAACGCADMKKKVFPGPVAGLEYRNQNTSPWPWVSVVPSERALAMLKTVDFEVISQQMHFDMAFEPHIEAFRDIRLVLLDYTILPEEISKDMLRPQRYFMTASFYKVGRRPPDSPDFEYTTSLRTDKAAPQEAMLYMARDIIEEIHALYYNCLLSPGRKIVINLD